MVDTHIPNINVADATNPVVQHLLNVPRFGFNCTPQMAAIKLRSSFAHVPAPHLIQDVAHAKSWITEQLITYIDGQLPDWLRKPKFIYDHKRQIQYAARIVATARLLIAMLNQEVALANAWANECSALVGFAKTELTTGNLRTEAESLLANQLDVAQAAINQQIEENTQNLKCLL
jgi:hypothetical protein